MKIVVGVVVLLVVAASLFADYKWKQWMAARRASNHDAFSTDPSRRDHQ